MNSPTSEHVVRQYFEMWNSGDQTLAEAVLSPDFVDFAHPEVKGLAAFKNTLEKTKTFFPDFHIDILSIASDADTVLVLGSISRTAKGEKTVTECLWAFKVAEGRILNWKTGTIATP